MEERAYCLGALVGPYLRASPSAGLGLAAFCLLDDLRLWRYFSFCFVLLPGNWGFLLFFFFCWREIGIFFSFLRLWRYLIFFFVFCFLFCCVAGNWGFFFLFLLAGNWGFLFFLFFFFLGVVLFFFSFLLAGNWGIRFKNFGWMLQKNNGSWLGILVGCFFREMFVFIF